MDCIESKEKIDLFVDNMLSDADKQRLMWHASTCPQCRKALDDAVRLKQALANIGEVTPPVGLAASSVRKAKRRHVPMFAYATAAAAAVITLAFALSPQLMRSNDMTGEGTEEKLMYSAAEADSAPMEGYGLDGANPEEAGEVPQAECSLSTGQAYASADVESALILSNKAPITFGSEQELTRAIQNDTEFVRGIAYYYRPAALPEDASLIYIEAGEFSVRWVYSLGADQTQTMVFEWYRTITMDDLQNWKDLNLLLNDSLAHYFKHSGDLFWSTEARLNGSGKLEATDGTVINAYWLEEGVAFHAELPVSFTEQDIIKYCNMASESIE